MCHYYSHLAKVDFLSLTILCKPIDILLNKWPSVSCYEKKMPSNWFSDWQRLKYIEETDLLKHPARRKVKYAHQLRLGVALRYYSLSSYTPYTYHNTSISSPPSVLPLECIFVLPLWLTPLSLSIPHLLAFLSLPSLVPLLLLLPSYLSLVFS